MKKKKENEETMVTTTQILQAITDKESNRGIQISRIAMINLCFIGYYASQTHTPIGGALTIAALAYNILTIYQGAGILRRSYDARKELEK